MELLNMFSDLAPISNSGYRKQLYTDPGILQGQEFLRNENKIKRLVERNLDLNLVSDVNGSESTIIHSVENFEPSEDNTLADTDADTYANTDTHNNYNHNNYKNKKDYNNFEEGLSLQKSKKKKVKKETEEEKETEKENEDRINNENELKQTIHSFVSCSIGEVVSKKTGKCVKSGEEGFETIIKEGFREGLTTDDKYNDLKDRYDTALTAYNTLITDFQTRYNGGLETTSSDPNAALSRTQVFTQLKNLSTQLNTISTQLLNSVKTDTRNDFNSYNKMQTEIDNVQLRIKQIYNKIQENKLKNPADIQTALAKENETELLTKQRYYMYIIWFIIMVVILYITITNLVNAESSFTVLLICLIVLVCLFLFFIYNKWNGEWYDFKYKLKNFNLGIPDIPKLDFNPLVRIRYTS